MRLWSALLFSAAAFILAACGAPKLGHPPLWRIADEDSEIWLFGTVHVLPDHLTWRSPEFDAAFAAADELITEADVSDAHATAALSARYGLLPPGESLQDQLAPETQARLTRVLTALNVAPAELDRMRPWLAALRLSYLFARSRGQESAAGVEAVLLPQAQARGMRLAYLETAEQQIRTLADLSDADQHRFLDSTLTDIESNADMLEGAQRAWAEGDLATLERALNEQMRSAGEGPYAALMTRRNAAWAAEIERRLAGSGRSFYAVGAAHLMGEGSVVALLRHNGIEVEGP